MTLRGAIMGFSALVLSSCAPAPQVVTSTLGPAPVLDGGSYTSGGGITVAAEIQQINGMTALCGVWAESVSARQSVLTKGVAGRVVATGSAVVDGAAIHRGLLFMRKVPPMDDYAGQTAHCVITERPWQAGDDARSVDIRIPRQVVHRETGGLGSIGMVITFRQTGPGA